jgi:sugar lactone lactonase YvrE
MNVWTAMVHCLLSSAGNRHRSAALPAGGIFHPERPMVHRRCMLAGGLALGMFAAGVGSRALAQSQAMAPATTRQPGPFRLVEAARFDHQVTGVAVSPDGRIFVTFPRWTEDSPISLAEVAKDGSLRPYPDEKWNGWRNTTGSNLSPRDHFVCAQSVVADMRGNLWVLDPAAPAMDKVISGGPKLVRIELANDTVAQVIRFGEDVALQGSYLNDVRVHPDGNRAFISDSGARGALIVVDLQKGHASPRLDGHPSTQPEMGVEVAVGSQKLQRPDGRPLQAAADGIALSHDGRTLFWQALTGRTLYSIDTAALMSDNPDEEARKVVKVGTTCVADGLLTSRDGQLYLTSPEDSSIKVWTGERAESVISDQRLSWPDSMAEAADGTIHVTASHLHEMPWFRHGAPTVLPTQLFRLVRS